MMGDNDRGRGRDREDEQEYRGERPRGGGRARGGGKGYAESVPPPESDKRYGKDQPPPPTPPGYDSGGGAPPRGRGYREDPPPPVKGYGDEEEADPPDTGYDDEVEPPASEAGYGDDEPADPVADYGGADPAPPAGDYGDDDDTPPDDGYGESEPPGAGYGADDDYDALPPDDNYQTESPSCGKEYGGQSTDPTDREFDESCTGADPLRDDEPEPRGSLRDFKIGKAKAETGRDIEPILESIAVGGPEYLAKRKAIEAAYAAATGPGDSPDNLRKKYCAADNAFMEAVNYMLAKAPGDHWNLLQRWIYRNMCVKGALVRKILIERRQIRMRLRDRKGPRELALQDAHERTVRWAAAFASWSDPVANIGAVIKSYESRIGVLKDLFNDKPTADKAIFEFWFEVAPLHLGLRPEPVDEDDEPGVKLIRASLTDFKDVRAQFANAVQRGAGGLYLIKAADLRRERARVLQQWDRAAGDEAVAKADYELRRDDAASLAAAYEKLRDDKWVGEVKTALSPPAAA